MSELLAFVIASVFLVSIGSDLSNMKAKGSADGVMTKRSAKLDFKVAENRTNAHYKFAISECKKGTSLDKMPCLDAAKLVNVKLIVAAKAKMDKTLAEPFVPNGIRAVASDRQ